MARMLKQALHISARAPSPEPECLEDHVHAELVPELESVGDRLLRAVDANWNAVDLVNLDAVPERGPGELEDPDWGVVDPGRILLPALDRDVHFVRHVARELVERERRYEADDSFRDTGRHGHERSEEHTSELQSLAYLVCRLLLEKKKKQLLPLFFSKKKKKKKKTKK